MRVNVYDHELTDRVELATATADNTGQSFYGVRIYIGETIIHQPGDDDTGAVTFWVPWTKADGHDPAILRRIFERGLAIVAEIEKDQALQEEASRA